MSRIGQPSAAFAGDQGDPDLVVRKAIAGAKDQFSYARAVVALCTTRLLMPLLNDDGELSAVSLVTDDGRKALLGFTGLDSLKIWHALARPVPCTLDDLAATVAEAGAEALLLDVAGPKTLVIEGEWLERLAGGQRLIEFDNGLFGWVTVVDDEETPAPHVKSPLEHAP